MSSVFSIIMPLRQSIRVAASNIAFITFLSLKNTPLGFLTGYSYERLNVHQVAGYCTITWSMLHAVVYVAAWSKTNSLPNLLEKSQVMGIISGFAMLAILGTALLLRKLRYEVFYIVHIIMFMLILIIVVGMHRPDLSRKTLVIILFAASIWVFDRVLRFLRISLLSLGNTATVTPLPFGGTRIMLRRSPGCATPGSHCFLWIPGIRMAETHPFTVVSNNSLEFVIAACDGFTRSSCFCTEASWWISQSFSRWLLWLRARFHRSNESASHRWRQWCQFLSWGGSRLGSQVGRLQEHGYRSHLGCQGTR